MTRGTRAGFELPPLQPPPPSHNLPLYNRARTPQSLLTPPAPATERISLRGVPLQL